MERDASQVDPDLLAGFLDEALEALDGLDASFVALEREGSNEIIQAIFRPIHSIKGNASFFGLSLIRSLAHDLEQVLDHARRGQVRITRQVSDVLLQGVDVLRLLLRSHQAGLENAEAITRATSLRRDLQQVATSPPVPATRSFPKGSRHPVATTLEALPRGQGPCLAELDRLTAWAGDDAARAALDAFRCDLDAILAAAGWSDVVADLLREQLPLLQERHRWIDPGHAPEDAVATEAAPPSATIRRSTTTQTRAGSDRREKDDTTLRVPSVQIDGFLAQVGELLVLGDLLGHVESRLVNLPGAEAATHDLRQALGVYHQVANHLRHSVMALRQVPGKRLLQKVPSLVRDVATARGKDIQAILDGELLGIDKAVLDLLDAPLVHLVRNAADHGIESPERRVQQGKPRSGTIRVSLRETDTSIVLTVVDDGAGLDLDRIAAKAAEAGLVVPGAPLTRDDLINFIFASGVSTAQDVTDISGRGVGLDVVRRAIEDAGGRIAITTATNQGTTFTIQVPKGARTQILGGFLVGVAGQRFILPLDRIQRAVALDGIARQRLPTGGERILLDGVTYPHYHLGTLTDGSAQAPEVLTVLLTAQRSVVSIGVSEVLGVRQVLVRPIEGRRCGPQVAGGSVMGDGLVAVVLDPDHLIPLDGS